MLVAALLFALGTAEGWNCRATALIASSMLVSLGWLALWALVWTTLDTEKVLLLFADLAAHQAGYLVGAYWGGATGKDR